MHANPKRIYSSKTRLAAGQPASHGSSGDSDPIRMNKPPAATISQGAGAFARVLLAERLTNAIRLNQLRFIVVIAFLLLEALPFIPKVQPMNRLALGILVA
jgi:hypothetical protein